MSVSEWYNDGYLILPPVSPIRPSDFLMGGHRDPHLRFLLETLMFSEGRCLVGRIRCVGPWTFSLFALSLYHNRLSLAGLKASVPKIWILFCVVLFEPVCIFFLFYCWANFGLFLSVPSNSKWVTSPRSSNIGAKGSKAGEGQEKADKNAHVLTVNIAVLPSLCDTMSLYLLPSLFWIKHPSVVWVIKFTLAVIVREKSISDASENWYFFD